MNGFIKNELLYSISDYKGELFCNSINDIFDGCVSYKEAQELFLENVDEVLEYIGIYGYSGDILSTINSVLIERALEEYSDLAGEIVTDDLIQAIAEREVEL